MDGRFVPNITIGPVVVGAIRKRTRLPLDVHLMIVEPERYIPEFVAAGADMVTVHAEACPHLSRTLALIRELGARAGAALNPSTPPDALEYVLDDLDLVLVMSVNPGLGDLRRRRSGGRGPGAPRCRDRALAQLPQFEGVGSDFSSTYEKSWHYI